MLFVVLVLSINNRWSNLPAWINQHAVSAEDRREGLSCHSFISFDISFFK